MKKIEAIIRPLKLDEVKLALGEYGVTGVSVSDVQGCGSSPIPIDVPAHRTNRGAMELPIRIRIEIVARDEDVQEIVTLIETHARTGEPGDGKIFVMPMTEAVRIRTQERGDLVL